GQETHSVVGHVFERIRRGDRPTRLDLGDHGGQVRRAELRQMGRSSDVAIVEPDDAKPFGREPLTERVRPARQSGREAHDEQNDRTAVAPDALVFDVDAVGADARHEREPRMICWRMTITGAPETARRGLGGNWLDSRGVRATSLATPAAGP